MSINKNQRNLLPGVARFFGSVLIMLLIRFQANRQQWLYATIYTPSSTMNQETK